MGTESGAHTLSGAILDPRSLNELIPNWKKLGAPLTQPVTQDQFLFLTATGAHRSPILPDCFHNDGCHVISLDNLVRWLATQAEALGFAYSPASPRPRRSTTPTGRSRAWQPATGNRGVGKDGEPGENFQLGMELHAKYPVFAEG